MCRNGYTRQNLVKNGEKSWEMACHLNLHHVVSLLLHPEDGANFLPPSRLSTLRYVYTSTALGSDD